MDWHQVIMDLCVVGIFSVAGILLLCVGFLVVKLIFPFSIKKEIEEEQNTSLALLAGALLLGMSIIIATVIGAFFRETGQVPAPKPAAEAGVKPAADKK